jgi:hypothetical protein
MTISDRVRRTPRSSPMTKTHPTSGTTAYPF